MDSVFLFLYFPLNTLKNDATIMVTYWLANGIDNRQQLNLVSTIAIHYLHFAKLKLKSHFKNNEK